MQYFGHTSSTLGERRPFCLKFWRGKRLNVVPASAFGEVCKVRKTGLRRPGLLSIPSAVSPTEVDYNPDLAELLASVKRPGSFYGSGSIETPMSRPEIEGAGTIAFPVLDHQTKEIVAQAERAPDRRGEAPFVETSVRRAWQIAPEKIRLGGKSWERALDSVLDMAVKGLSCGGGPVSAELYCESIDI